MCGDQRNELRSVFWQALLGFEVAVVEWQREIVQIDMRDLGTGGAHLPNRDREKFLVQRISSRAAREGEDAKWFSHVLDTIARAHTRNAVAHLFLFTHGLDAGVSRFFQRLVMSLRRTIQRTRTRNFASNSLSKCLIAHETPSCHLPGQFNV